MNESNEREAASVLPVRNSDVLEKPWLLLGGEMWGAFFMALTVTWLQAQFPPLDPFGHLTALILATPSVL